MQAFAWNCRNQCSDGKGEAQAAKTARREYRSEHWGGPIRISDEGPVMGLERRDRVRQSYGRNNWKQEDADSYDRQTVQYYKEASV